MLEPRLLLSADASVVRNGCFEFLDAAVGAMDTKVFGISIPIVGTGLQNGANFLADMRDKLDDAFESYQTDPPLEGNAHVQMAVYKAFKTDLNLLVLSDLNSDSLLDWRDVPVLETPDFAQFAVHLYTTAFAYEDEFDVGFDSGLPVLQFSAEGTVNFTVGVDFYFTFGALKTSPAQTFYVNTVLADELKVSVHASIPDFQAEMSFGPMTGTLTDEDADENPYNNAEVDLDHDGVMDNDLDKDGFLPSALGAAFAIDLVEPSGDGVLILPEMYAHGFANLVTARVSGDLHRDIDGYATVADDCLVDINVHLDYSGFGVIEELLFGSSSSGEMKLPHWSADFRFAWFLSDRTTDSIGLSDPLDKIPVVEFNNITLHLGEFISTFAGPVLKGYQLIMLPTKPLRDFLGQRLPIVSDVADQDITLIELAGLIPKYGQLIQMLYQLDMAVENCNALSSDIGLNYGNFTLMGDLREYNKLQEARSNILSNLRSLTSDVLGTELGLDTGKFGFLTNQVGAGQPGLSFPILTNPTEIVSLLLGGDARLIELNLPEVGLNFSWGAKFPIFPPFLNVGLGGYFDFGIRFGFGYDTAGIRMMAEDPNHDPALLGEGFYISDHHEMGMPDLPEAWLRAGITGSAFAGVPGLVEGGVRGGIRGEIVLDFHDPDQDGRIRISELRRQLGSGNPFRMFDAYGSLDGFFEAYVWVGLDLWLFTITIYEDSWTIASGTILDFNWGIAEDIDPPVLGTQVGDTLYLHMGPLAGNRVYGSTSDGNESFTVKRRTVNGTDKIVLAAYGFEQEFDAATISYVRAEGGGGNDTLRVLDSEEAPLGADVVFYGDFDPARGFGGYGPGGAAQFDSYDDKLYATYGPVTFYGGPGDDRLNGGAGDDYLYGGPGDDSIYGKAGNDRIEGDDGKDFIDGGDGIDLIYGGAGDDRLQGGRGDDEIYGQDGKDLLKGHAGEDLLYGGAGDDRLYGGSGADLLAGGPGKDEILGDSGNDLLRGQDDQDTIFGNADDDELFGDAGDDYVFGDSGAVNNEQFEFELLYKVDENGRLILDENGEPIPADPGTIWTLSFTPTQGSDAVHGGTGDDVLFGDNGMIVLDANDNITQILPLAGEMAGDDRLYGDAGNDILLGGTGNDAYFFADGFGEDEVRESASGGTDTVDFSAVTAQLTVVFGSLLVRDDAGNRMTHEGEFVERLVCGAADDRFVFPDGANVNMILDGGPGTDTLDFSADTQGVTIDLSQQLCGRVYGGQAGGVLNFEQAIGGSGDDTLIGDDGPNLLAGGLGDDTLIGLGGDDTLEGGSGDDMLDGGADDDVYIQTPGSHDAFFDSDGIDELDFSGAGGGIRVDLRLDAGQRQRVDSDDDTIAITGVIENVTGSEFDDRIIGNRSANVIRGLGGNDVLDGFDGDDAIYGGAGDDWLRGDRGNDYLAGDEGNDRLDGHQGDDELSGGEGNDLLMGQAGDDLLRGGEGDDWLKGQAGSDRLEGGGGNDDLRGGGGDDVLLGDGGDDRLSGNAGHDELHGGDGDDLLSGSDGNNVLAGDAGDDRLRGGPGRDTADYSAEPGGVSVYLLAATAADSSGGTDVLSGIEDISGSAYDDTLVGNRRANRLYGLGGNDLLRGAGGGDVLVGGQDEDTVLGDTGADLIVWNEGDGDDMVDGGAGMDRLRVDARAPGDQHLAVQAQQHRIQLSRTSAAGFTLDADAVERLDLSCWDGDDQVTVGPLVGAALAGLRADLGGGNDTLDGVSSTVWMIVLGGAGDDVFRGGGGSDRFYGGEGQDTADYSQAPSGARIRLGGAPSPDGAGGRDRLFGTEALIGSDYDDLLIGDRHGNRIMGGEGNDRIYGGRGADTLYGGQGRDLLYGQAGDDLLMGQEGEDRIWGGRGLDLLNGGEGSDDLWGQAGADTLFGSAGADRLWGGSGADQLNGGEDDDMLFGGRGDDRLQGGMGNDHTDGGSGFDVANFSGASGPVNVDLLTGRADDGEGFVDLLAGVEEVLQP
jgi:Ca2+-binding RTX toxin-like protein